MKVNSFRKYLLFCAALLCSIVACSKKDYLIDGGKSSNNSSYSTYDYLANHQDHYFDTVLLLIDHFGLKDSVNRAGTFFAPTDFSVNLLMKGQEIYSLEELYNHVSSKLLTQYMFTDTSISLANATTVSVAHQNWADTICGIKKTAYTYSSVSTFTYYVLQYTKINGYLDGSSGVPANDPVDAVLNCQTTGIKTATGTTLHVLASNANLNIR